MFLKQQFHSPRNATNPWYADISDIQCSNFYIV